MKNNVLVAAGATIFFALGWAFGRRHRTLNVGTIRVILEHVPLIPRAQGAATHSAAGRLRSPHDIFNRQRPGLGSASKPISQKEGLL